MSQNINYYTDHAEVLFIVIKSTRNVVKLFLCSYLLLDNIFGNIKKKLSENVIGNTEKNIFTKHFSYLFFILLLCIYLPV